MKELNKVGPNIYKIGPSEQELKNKNRKQELDKDKLQLAISEAIRTTMIGAIASIEEKFGSLWGHGENRQLTDKEKNLRETFMEMRKVILDKGNTQIRACKSLVDGYSVEFIGYTITLPVVRRN